MSVECPKGFSRAGYARSTHEPAYIESRLQTMKLQTSPEWHLDKRILGDSSVRVRVRVWRGNRKIPVAFTYSYTYSYTHISPDCLAPADPYLSAIPD